jgi:AraC-like DNA-binding protein
MWFGTYDGLNRYYCDKFKVFRNRLSDQSSLPYNYIYCIAEDVQFLKMCMAIIDRHMKDDSFNIKKLSTQIGMSHSVLYRKVKAISGQSIASFIRFIRLRRAAELMIQTNLTINEISLEVGIGDPKYFRLHFNTLFGMNPSDYIKKYRPSPSSRSGGKKK